MIPFEFVVRGYVFGSMWEAYKKREENERQENIAHEDVVVLIGLLELLYENLYGEIEEFEGRSGNIVVKRVIMVINL